MSLFSIREEIKKKKKKKVAGICTAETAVAKIALLGDGFYISYIRDNVKQPYVVLCPYPKIT